MSTNLKSKEKKTPWLVIALIGLLVLGITALMVFGWSAGWDSKAGFLLKNSNLLADISLITQGIALLGMSAAVIFVKFKNTPAHKYSMITWVLVNLILTAFFMIKRFSEFVLPGMPGVLQSLFGKLSLAHAILGLFAVLAGIYLILRMTLTLPKALRLKPWKRMMLITFLLYWLVGVVGFWIYLVLYNV